MAQVYEPCSVQTMSKILLRPVESHLYKYGAGNIERLEPVITKSELYFPAPVQLNDPAEAKPKLAKLSQEKMFSFLYYRFVVNNPGLSRENYQKTKIQIENNGKRFGSEVLLKKMSKALHTELETLRIYSMSKRPDNMALWAKYADHHKGYCLEFANTGLFAAAREVTYAETVDFDPTDPEQINVDFLFHKTPDWQTEEEVRLIAPRGTKPTIKFEPNLLTRIIVGQHMADSEISVIRRWASLRSPKLSVVRAEYDIFEHKLNFIPFGR